MVSSDRQATARDGARRLAAVLMLAGVLLPGCLITPFRGAQAVKISDDGQLAACATVQGVFVMLKAVFIVHPGTGHIRWTHADSWFTRSRRLYCSIGGGHGYTSPPEFLAIAPDSQHLAFTYLDPREIVIVETETGRSRVLDRGRSESGGRPVSLVWLNESEVACAWQEDVKPSPGVGHDPSLPGHRRMIIYRYDIKSGSGDPHEVFGSRVMSLPRWSPGGKHVALKPCPWIMGRIPVVNVETGETLAELGRKGEYFRAVAWTPDGRGFLLASTNPVKLMMLSHEMAGMRLSYFNTATRHTTVVDWDSLAGYAELYLGTEDPDRFSNHALEHMEWTADGRFVVGNFPGYQGCLLDFKARKLISLREKLDERFSRIGWRGVKWTELHAFPVPGWLWTKADNGNSYAVDYQVRHVVLISKDEVWDVSRDGRRIAETNLFLNPVIRDFKLPDLTPVAGN